MFPPPAGWVWMQAFAPIDDYNTMFYFFQVSEVPLTEERRAGLLASACLRPGIDVDENHRLRGNRDNMWLQDRAAMRRGESHTGIGGVSPEDVAIQESMGRMLDRTKEHLGVSDTAVIRFRRQMLDAAKRFAERDETPVGLTDHVPYGELRAEEKMLPIEDSWLSVGAAGAEPVTA
jgi:phthalate 4,5-dioxygenase